MQISNNLHTVLGGCVLPSTQPRHQQSQQITPTTTSLDNAAASLLPSCPKQKHTTNKRARTTTTSFGPQVKFFKCFYCFVSTNIFFSLLIGFNHDDGCHNHPKLYPEPPPRATARGVETGSITTGTGMTDRNNHNRHHQNDDDDHHNDDNHQNYDNDLGQDNDTTGRRDDGETASQPRL